MGDEDHKFFEFLDRYQVASEALSKIPLVAYCKKLGEFLGQKSRERRLVAEALAAPNVASNNSAAVLPRDEPELLPQPDPPPERAEPPPDLLKIGRGSYAVADAPLIKLRDNAVLRMLMDKGKPGNGGTVGWKHFCDAVRKNCEKTSGNRGYSDRSIKRVVTNFKSKPE